MSVSLPTQTDIKARWARLGRPMSNPVVVIHRLPSAVSSPAPAADAQAAGVSSDVSPAATVFEITSRQFAWAHRLADELGGDPCPIITRGEWRVVLRYACSTFNVSMIDIVSQRRTSTVVWPRQCVFWALGTHTTMSLPEIGDRLGGKDHTTVLHGKRRVQREIDAHSIDVGVTWWEAIDALAKHNFRSFAYKRMMAGAA